jgi:peptide/nickel transport system permease protein
MSETVINVWGRAVRNRKMTVGFFLILLPILFSLAAPLAANHDPNEQILMSRLRSPLSAENDKVHYFGTDGLGRDIYSRVVYGSRVSLIVGITVVLIGGTIGVSLGVLAGYFGGAVDSIIMRLIDIFLAFPFLLLALSIMAFLGPGLGKVILVLGITSWVPYARIARARVLSLKENEFVEACNALGATPMRIILKHILPNILSSVIVVASFRVATAILGEATLSFLGLGVGAGTPSWGSMLSEGREYLFFAWWPATLPGLMILLTVLGINLFGDGLRDIMDPSIVVN